MERYPKPPTETMPRSGKVSEVVQEWLVKEDGALATRLQNEEISEHYQQNRFRNGMLRTDVPRARNEQLKEDEEAAYRQAVQEQRRYEQYAADAEIARRMALEVETEEEKRRRQQETEDFALAARLQEEEKVRRRQEREERQVSHEARILGLEAPARALRLTSPPGAEQTYPDDDLSDLMAPPPSLGHPLSEDEVRSWQEEQDEEVARLLQEQETKRRGDVLPADRLASIEAQDRELAKVLQEQERARLRRAKERAREKRRLRQERERQLVAAGGSGDDLSADSGAETGVKLRMAGAVACVGELECAAPRDTSSPLPSDRPARHPESPRGRPWPAEPDPPVPLPRSPARPWPADPAADLTAPPPRPVSRGRGHTSPPPRAEPAAAAGAPHGKSVSPAGLNNIAMMIDPTYQRRLAGSAAAPEPPRALPREPSPVAAPADGSGADYGAASAQLPEPELDAGYEDGDEDLAPPYMPIQGQRRLHAAALEKGRRRRGKDGANCKQQ